MEVIKKYLYNLKSNILLCFSAISSVILFLLPDIDVLLGVICLIVLIIILCLLNEKKEKIYITKPIKITSWLFTLLFCVFETVSSYKIWNNNTYINDLLVRFKFPSHILIIFFVLISAASSFFVNFIFVNILSRIHDNGKKLNFDYFEIIIFVLSSILFFSISLFIINYNKNDIDFFFGADSKRALFDLLGNSAMGFYRITVHPLILVLITPFVLLVKCIIRSDLTAVLIVESLSAALGTVFVYRSLDLLIHRKYLKIIFTLLYVFSFSTLVFVSIPETYVFSGMFLSAFFYWVIKKIKTENRYLHSEDFGTIIFWGCVCFGITLTNYVVFLLGIIFLLIYTDNRIKAKIFEFIKIFLTSIFSVLYLGIFQTRIFQAAPVFYNQFVNSFLNKVFKISINDTSFEEMVFVDLSFSLKKIKGVFSGFISAVIPSGLKLSEKNLLEFCEYNKIIFYSVCIAAVILFSRLIYLCIKERNKYIVFTWILLLFNIVLHFFYGSNEVFLYSQHYTYLIIILTALLFDSIPQKSKKSEFIMKPVLAVISVIIIANSLYRFMQFIILNKSHYGVAEFNTSSLIIYAVLFSLFIVLISVIYKIFRKKRQGEDCKTFNIIYLYSLLSVVLAVVIALLPETIVFSSNKNNQKPVFNEIDKAVTDVFIEHFPEEVNSFMLYQKQYKELIEATGAELTDINGSSDEYYFFGFNNRKKYLYINGMIKDIENNNIVYKFSKPDKQLIIPNEYTVLVHTKDGEYIKIFENSDGVFVSDKSLRAVPGTDTNVNVFDFKDKNYSEVLSTLYGEILFNTKNSQIIPNIFVYSNSWYRDAAITSMVYSYTGNVSIIEPWIDSLCDIYDMQNGGVRESDNLGELLYLLSLSKNRNHTLINKILHEAKIITENNPDGNYLNGETDFNSNMSNYQTAWYNLGLESLGMDELSLDNNIAEDIYSSTMWWSDNYSKKCLLKPNANYPYLAWAQYHCTGSGGVFLNNSLYPLSWESAASQADYNKMSFLDNCFIEKKISPTHTWTAAEIFMTIVEKFN